MTRPDPPPGRDQAPAPRAHTLPIQGLVNKIVRALLCTPLLSRGVGKRLITVYVVGRKTGRHYSVPIAYSRRGETLLVGTQFRWIRNLRTGEPVQVRLVGKRRTCDVQVLTDEPSVVEYLAFMASDNHQFAKFNQIGLDERGEPKSEDLHLAWAAGA